MDRNKGHNFSAQCLLPGANRHWNGYPYKTACEMD
jgi:hypothetical protein